MTCQWNGDAAGASSPIPTEDAGHLWRPLVPDAFLASVSVDTSPLLISQVAIVDCADRFIGSCLSADCFPRSQACYSNPFHYFSLRSWSDSLLDICRWHLYARDQMPGQALSSSISACHEIIPRRHIDHRVVIVRIDLPPVRNSAITSEFWSYLLPCH